MCQGAPNEVTPELEKLRKRLENKIKVGKLRVQAELQIVTPAIDLIERMYELPILENALTDMAVPPEAILA